MSRRGSIFRLGGAVVAASILSACGGGGSTASQVPSARGGQVQGFSRSDGRVDEGRRIRVMTYNVDEGTDYDELASAHTPTAFLLAVGQTISSVRATDPRARMSALARQVLQERPDIVNLQEVTVWLTGPFNPSTQQCGTVAPEFDLLDELRSALARQGGHYDLVVQAAQLSVPPVPGLIPPTNFFCAAVSNRIAMLARTARDDDGNRLKLSNVKSGQFQAKLSIPTPIGLLPAPRAWVSADVTLHHQTFRVIGTHLESFAASVRELQGAELRNGPAQTSLPVVIAMDSNAKANPAPVDPTYTDFINAGFADAWTTVKPADPGLTCCQAPLVNNPFSQLYERIDLVLTRGGLLAEEVERIGIDASSRTPSGLWPSDHAGVVGTLRLSP